MQAMSIGSFLFVCIVAPAVVIVGLWLAFEWQMAAYNASYVFRDRSKKQPPTSI